MSKSATQSSPAPARDQIVQELFKPARRRFPRRKVVLKSINDLLQADLGDFQRLKSFNSGYRYLLVVINAFSKKAYVRPLKNKTAKATAEAMESILEEAKTKFNLAQTDEGVEFGGPFLKVLEKHGIKHYHTYTGLKASIVERLIRTIKLKLYVAMAKAGSQRWVDLVNKVVEDYNNTKHRTIKLAPNQVNKSNEKMLLDTVYNYNRELAKPRFAKNQQVRVSKKKFVFSRSFFPTWTEQIYIIDGINAKYPITYTLKTLDDKKVEGTFYESELQKVQNPDILLIEKILQKKGKLAKVRWAGYDSSFDSWIKLSELYDAKQKKKKRRRKRY